MGWLGEPSALVWPKVSGADELTGWAVSSAVTKGRWSWWVDWVSRQLRCDQRSVELMGWLGEPSAPPWPKVSGADQLFGWAVRSAVTKGQWSWSVDWVSRQLRCDQRSVELICWLGELSAPLWPKVSWADGLTGWAVSSAVTKGQWSWSVDWVSRQLRCDQRSVELMGWLGEPSAPLWPKVSGADGLTGWAVSSAVIKGQWSWWVDYVSCQLRGDQRSVELISWLGELSAPLWPKVSGADGLTTWAVSSAVIKGQWSWSVDWVSCQLRRDQRSVELISCLYVRLSV